LAFDFKRYLAGRTKSLLMQFMSCPSQLPAKLLELPHHGSFEQRCLRHFCDASAEREILDQAGQIIRHRFDLLGSGLTDCSAPAKGWIPQRPASFFRPDYGPIDWHRDFRSGYRWSEECRPKFALEEYRRYRGVDIKWPWELSRCQHLPPLAVASYFPRQNSDFDSEPYFDEFRDQISDWILNNPTGVGVNWACEMDIAIRVVNWVVAFWLFNRKVDQTDPWQRRFWSVVVDHCKLLYDNLRFPHGKRGNHYASELAGLFMVAILCPFLRQSQKWRRLAKVGLEEQVRVQVRDDGAHFEESTSYHMLVTEVFLYPLLLAEATGEPFSTDYKGKVMKMTDVIETLCSVRYFMPQIGDNDDAYFLKPIPLSSRERRVQHLIRLGNSLREEENKSSVREQLLRMILINSEALGVSKDGPIGVTVLPEAGWALLRRDPMQVNMCVGPVGASVSGHGHEDELSISVFWDGWPVIVDPGTFCYTPFPEKRKALRCRYSHNQPQFVQSETGWNDRSVFARITRPVTRWDNDASQLGIKAKCHHGNYVSERRVSLDITHKVIRAEESLEGQGLARIALCLAPGVSCQQVDKDHLLLRVHDRSLSLKLQGVSFDVRRGPYSSGYGRICETNWLVSESNGAGFSGEWALMER